MDWMEWWPMDTGSTRIAFDHCLVRVLNTLQYAYGLWTMDWMDGCGRNQNNGEREREREGEKSFEECMPLQFVHDCVCVVWYYRYEYRENEKTKKKKNRNKKQTL